MSRKVLETISMWMMVGGIIFLCQPWVGFLHAYSVLVMLIGLIGFNVAAHMKQAPEVRIDEDDTGPVSVSQTVKSGGGHG